MPFNQAPYSVILYVFAPLLLIVGAYAFGSPLIFDRALVVALVATLLICRNNINLLGVVVIFLVHRVADELLWLFNEFTEEIIVKALFYTIVLACYRVVKDEPVHKIIAPIIWIVAVASEVFWYITDYPAPKILWTVKMIALQLVTVRALFYRTYYTKQWLPQPGVTGLYEVEFIAINVFLAGIWINYIYILEYVFRHIFGINSTYIYYAYPYLIQGLAAYMLWVIIVENISATKERLIAT